MTDVVKQLEQIWSSRLLDHGEQERQSIFLWLIGEESSRLEQLNQRELEIIDQGMDFRYRLLRERYLRVNPTRAYRNLIGRLGSLMMVREKIRTWVALSRDRSRAVADVLQEVIQEMLRSDRYIQQQIGWIAQCTEDKRLRNNLLLASLEEYCLRPIRNQPLLSYRFVNFLRRQERGGMTQVPRSEIVQFISEKISSQENDTEISLLDQEAVQEYQKTQQVEEQQLLRSRVQEEFESYLAENVGSEAVRWLKLYLQGRSQEAIAKTLDLPIKQVYRLREKVNYHALKVFALKIRPDLVNNWLEISLKRHDLGLTPKQWQNLKTNLTPLQRDILEKLKLGQNVAEIATELQYKTNQVMSEWTKIYLSAQTIRNLDSA